ncbi:hypothetical protein BD310DRAFT_827792, partial [Dichomitus squalens]
LQRISFNVGSNKEMHPWWKTRIAECYPLLLSQGMLDVVITRERIYRPNWF